MNRLKKIGKGILGGTTVVIGAAIGFGSGFLQLTTEELINGIIDNLF